MGGSEPAYVHSADEELRDQGRASPVALLLMLSLTAEQIPPCQLILSPHAWAKGFVLLPLQEHLHRPRLLCQW